MLYKNHSTQTALLSLLAALILAACTVPTLTPAPSPFKSPLNTPASPAPSNPAPTPKSGTGAVIGRTVAGSLDGPGYVGDELYLGSLIPASDPQAEPMISLSENVDPKADIYQSDGYFAFNNVQPGNYALVMWNPVSSFVVELPNGSGMVQVKVEPDKVTDLGVIVIP